MSAEASFDTNVLLYLLSGDPAKAGRSEALLAEGGGALSVQILNEFASVCRRKLGLDLSEVREFVETFLAVCEVVPLDVTLHEDGVALACRHQLSACDGLIVAAAVRAPAAPRSSPRTSTTASASALSPSSIRSSTDWPRKGACSQRSVTPAG